MSTPISISHLPTSISPNMHRLCHPYWSRGEELYSSDNAYVKMWRASKKAFFLLFMCQLKSGLKVLWIPFRIACDVLLHP